MLKQARGRVPLRQEVSNLRALPNSLPSSLFLVTNLTVLSLRKRVQVPSSLRRMLMLSRIIGGNQLERLPAGIGQLKRLKELNVSNNRLVSCVHCAATTITRSDNRSAGRSENLSSFVIGLDRIDRLQLHQQPTLASCSRDRHFGS